MREDLPSLTACVVAWARATASLTHAGSLDLNDAVTRSLLPRPFALATDLLARAGEQVPWLPRVVFDVSLGLFDHVVLRTAAIDDALVRAVAAGAEQLVILGAGLDARVHRMPELRAVTVFEVDHPASQRFKRDKAQALAVLAKRLSYVAVNFERDRLDERLRTAGFDPTRRTFWIWEGVVPYLQRPAIEGTLRVVRELSAPGSEIVATYVTDEVDWVRRRRVLTQTALHVIGEPLRTTLTVNEAATLMRGAGLTPLADTHAPDWHASFARDPQRTVPPALEHIIHARRA